MSNNRDYVIKKGVLIKYNGKDKKAVIPDSVTKIGSGAFNRCDFITAVVVPESITDICSHAFNSCRNLAELSLPRRDITIHYGAFKDCRKLADEKGFVIIRNILFDYFGSESILYVPENVTEISGYTFMSRRDIKTIVLPEGVTKIGKCAFLWCRGLERLVIPSTLSRIDKEPFDYCENLKEIVLSDTVFTFKGSVCELLLNSRYIGKDIKTVVRAAIARQCVGAAADDPKLRRILDRNKRDIVKHAVSVNDARILQGLFSLLKKPSVDEMDEYIQCSMDASECLSCLMDYKNSNYTVRELDDAEKTRTDKALGIREYTIADWKKLYRFKKNDEGIVITEYIGSESNIAIPSYIGRDKVVEIGELAFCWKRRLFDEEYIKKMNGINSVVVPDTVTRIGKSAFEGCKNLTYVRIPDSVEYLGESAFSCCTSLTEFTLPGALSRIEKSLFLKCDRLSNVVIPCSVRYIDNGAFEECSNLSDIRIPDSVTEIGMFVFSECTALRSIHIPDSVKHMHFWTFNRCHNVTVYGKKGSYAEQYAKSNNLFFIEN